MDPSLILLSAILCPRYSHISHLPPRDRLKWPVTFPSGVGPPNRPHRLKWGVLGHLFLKQPFTPPDT